MNCVQHVFRMAVYNFPMQDVRAMGQTLLGILESRLAACLPRRCRSPTFHCDVTDEVDQQVMNRWSNAGMRDGQFLNMR